MPFIAVIYCRDNNEAREVWADSTQDGHGRIVALYDFPAKSDPECPGFACPHQRSSGENVYGYGRHHTGQHIVHGACQRRRKGFRKRVALALMDLFGVNLLPPDITPALFGNPTNYDRPDAFPPLP